MTENLAYLELIDTKKTPLLKSGIVPINEVDSLITGSRRTSGHVVRVFAQGVSLGQSAPGDEVRLFTYANDAVTALEGAPFYERVIKARSTTQGGSGFHFASFDPDTKIFRALPSAEEPEALDRVLVRWFRRQPKQAVRLLVQVDATSKALKAISVQMDTLMTSVREAMQASWIQTPAVPEAMPEQSLQSAAAPGAKRRRDFAQGWPAALEVNAMLGSIAGNARQKPARLRKTGQLLGVWVDAENRYLYPPFQFHRDELRPEMKTLLSILPPDNGSGWGRAQWFYTPHTLLSGKTPAEVFARDPNRVIEVATREFAEEPNAGW